MQTVQVSALNNRVPGAVLAIEVVGAAVALGLLALYLAILARGVLSVVLAAAFVSVLLLITFDLDRPVRGLVTVPDHPARRSARVDGAAPCGEQGAGLDARDETRHRVDRLRPREALPADERAPRLELERVPDRRSDALAAWPAV